MQAHFARAAVGVAETQPEDHQSYSSCLHPTHFHSFFFDLESYILSIDLQRPSQDIHKIVEGMSFFKDNI